MKFNCWRRSVGRTFVGGLNFLYSLTSFKKVFSEENGTVENEIDWHPFVSFFNLFLFLLCSKFHFISFFILFHFFRIHGFLTFMFKLKCWALVWGFLLYKCERLRRREREAKDERFIIIFSIVNIASGMSL